MLKNLDNKNIQQQWEIIQLYMVFVFRKGKDYDNKDNKNKYIPYIIKNNIQFKNFEPELNEGTFD